MRKNISITLDRERNLRLDLNAMSVFEDVTGKSLFTIGEGLQEARNVRALLYAAMKSAGEDITLEQVGENITMHNFSMVSEVISKLMTVSYGKPLDEVEEGKK